MSLELVAKIASEIKELTDEVACHILGDPLMVKNISDYLDIFHANGLKTILTTSGFPLQKMDFEIFSHPSIKQINISLHSFFANSHKLLLDEYLESIFRLCEIPHKYFVNLRYWVESDSKCVLFEKLENEFGASISTSSEPIRLAPYTRLHFDECFVWPSLESHHQSSGFCHGLSAQFGVLADGTVVPCCLDKDGVINLGSAQNSPLSDLLSSERAKLIRDGFRKNIATEELCRKCEYKGRFATIVQKFQGKTT